jgi:AcrR family transcriptional regulator
MDTSTATITPSDELDGSVARKRPMRADARRNYEKVLDAARESFAAGGAATSLEEVARHAGVGIGTLYRHFPNRQALLEAVYIHELEAIAGAADELRDLDPWEALSTWLHRFVRYVSTKHALAAELLEYVNKDACFFMECRATVYRAAEPLVERARAAGEIRSDASFQEIISLVVGVAKIQADSPAQIDHILNIALDGLRYRA